MERNEADLVTLPRYPEYKASGATWFTDVPCEWQVAPLKRSVRLLTDKTDRRQNPVALENIVGWSGSFVATGNEFQGDGVAFEKGDVLFGKLRPYLAKVYLADRPGEAIGDFLVMRPSSRVVGRFLQYQLLDRRFIDIVDGSTFGSKMPRASWEFVGGLGIALPPPDEQTRIAAFLDRETSKIDALVAEQLRLIELLKEKRLAVISQSVTGGLNPHAPLKDSGIEWLGEVPTHWKVVSFKRLAKLGTHTFADGDWIEAPYITNDGVRLLQTGNIGIGSFREQGYRYVSDETFNELRCTEVRPRDVLICRLDGPVGRACLAPDLGVRMITSVDNAILKCADDVVPEFVVALLSSAQWLSWIDALCRVGGGFRLRISRNQLGEIQVPLPPIDEQRVIAEHLNALGLETENLTTEALRAIDLLKERRAAIIAAAVTGQFDVRRLGENSVAA